MYDTATNIALNSQGNYTWILRTKMTQILTAWKKQTPVCVYGPPEEKDYSHMKNRHNYLHAQILELEKQPYTLIQLIKPTLFNIKIFRIKFCWGKFSYFWIH